MDQTHQHDIIQLEEKGIHKSMESMVPFAPSLKTQIPKLHIVHSFTIYVNIPKEKEGINLNIRMVVTSRGKRREDLIMGLYRKKLKVLVMFPFLI